MEATMMYGNKRRKGHAKQNGCGMARSARIEALESRVYFSAAPVITSPTAAIFTTEQASTFTVTTTGSPTAALTETGNLPAGVIFTDDANGMATFSGIPVPGTAGEYPVTVTAANGISTASQTLTLTVDTAGWTGAGDGINWNDPANWSDNQIPGPTDEVWIPAEPYAIQIAQGAFSVFSLTSNSSLQILSNGSLQLLAPSTLNASLTISSGGTLDIANASLAINYGVGNASPLATIQGYLSTGYNNGAWNGTGIISSTAAANPRDSVGVADGSATSGTAAKPGQVLIKYTLAGDAQLVGTVSFSDLGIVGQQLNTLGNSWTGGNFTNDSNGSVGFGDLGILAQNLNQQLTPAASTGELTGIAVPSTPIDLVATAASDTEISLTWDRVGAGETSITVWRSTGGGAYQVLQELPAGSNIFTDTSCYPGTTYSYKVTADNIGGSSSPSAPASATTMSSEATLPAATNLSATATSPFTINLSWTDNVQVYREWLVERSSNGISYAIVAVVDGDGATETYTDTPLSPGTTYYYRIRASGGSGYSDYTQPVFATTPRRATDTPLEAGNLIATVNSATETTLTWIDNNNGNASYIIQTAPFNYSGGNNGDGGYGAWTTVGQTATGGDSYDLTTTPETFYYVRICAVNPAGDSGYTAPVTVRSASPGTGSPKVYTIGPGEEYASLGAFNWSQLGPGDTVEIFPNRDSSGNIIPYYEKPLISVRGTAAEPINIIGMPDPTTGQLPIIDGTNAVTNSQWILSSGHMVLEDSSLLLIGQRPNQTSVGYSPGYLNISNLDLRNAYSGNPGTTDTFIAADGSIQPYNFAAGIYIEDGDHITISGCSLHGNDLGVFGAGQGDQRNLAEITLDGNDIYDNGDIGQESEHNTYLEGINTIYEYNTYGPLRDGAEGAGLKDRGAGTIIRYNTISGGAHLIDLVESQNYFDTVIPMPSYNSTYVYGNVLYNDFSVTGDTTLIYYGGDQGVTSAYRKGVLYFYNNTVVNVADQSQDYKFSVFDLASSGETLDARNNIILNVSQTAGQPAPEMDMFGAIYGYGGFSVGYFGTNWVSSGWLDSPNGYGPFNGYIAGLTNLIGNSQNNPGFISLASLDFYLASNSQCLDAESELSGSAPPVDSEYVDSPPGDGVPFLPLIADLGAFQ